MKAAIGTIHAVGKSDAVLIPPAMLSRYGLAYGDCVQLSETEQGILISPCDPELAEGMSVYREGADTFRNALHRLAE